MKKLKITIIIVVFLVVIFISQAAHARNVSYKGGWTLLGYFDDDSAASLIHYTPHRNYSVGYRYEYFREREWHYNGLQLNYLAKRWNNPKSQANLYLLSSIGNAFSNFEDLDEEKETAGFIGMTADWEDRRYFVSYENRYVQAGSIDESFTQKGRIGIAPYVAEFGQLHTWFMVEVNHNDGREDKITVTPLLRFFKSNIMTEIGYTVDGGPLVNLRVLF